MIFRKPYCKEEEKRSQGGPLARLAVLTLCVALAACGSTSKVTSRSGSNGSGVSGTAASGTTTTTPSSTAPRQLPPGYRDDSTVPPGRSYVPPAKAGALSQVPVSTGPGASTAAVSVIRPDASTLTSFGAAFDSYERFPAACSDTVPGTVHVARVEATGVMWAIAGLRPDPTCRVLHDGQMVVPTDIGPFGFVPQPPVGVFEHTPGQQWSMTTEVGKPFPCPPTPGRDPLVPNDVLKAWEIPYYSPTCISYPAPQFP